RYIRTRRFGSSGFPKPGNWVCLADSLSVAGIHGAGKRDDATADLRKASRGGSLGFTSEVRGGRTWSTHWASCGGIVRWGTAKGRSRTGFGGQSLGPAGRRAHWKSGCQDRRDDLRSPDVPAPVTSAHIDFRYSQFVVRAKMRPYFAAGGRSSGREIT